MTSLVERARSAFARQDWKDAFVAFTAAGERTELGAAEHERLAICAYLLGKDDACADAWEAAHRAALKAGKPAEAARSAFWLAFCLMMRGQMAQAGGWLARAERLVAGLDCAAAGYLLIPALLGALGGGHAATARDLGVEASELGNRFGDADLRAFGTLGHGQALIVAGDVSGGNARLDEVMVAVTAGEVGPITSGTVYCAVILECMQLFDFRGRPSGPMHSARGAMPSPTLCRIEGSAWCTGPSSSRPPVIGAMRSLPRRRHAGVSGIRLIRRSGSPTTSRRNSTGWSETSTRPRRCTGRQAEAGINRCPASHF